MKKSYPLESRVARVEGTLEQMNQRIGGIETRMGALEQKVDTGFNELRRDIQAINNRVTAIVLIGVLILILLQVVILLRTAPQ